MKKYFCLFMVTMLTMALTACGEKTTENTPSEKPVEYTGEGEVQGGIPTDEELAEREEEAKTYEEASEEPTVDYSDANVEMETTPTASDTYISADNFWQGEDYFDLEEYLYMNGASKINRKYYDSSGMIVAVEGENEPVSIYEARFDNLYWRVTIAAPNAVYIQFTGYKKDGHPMLAPGYNIALHESVDDWKLVKVNQTGLECTKNTIIALDHVMYLIKSHPGDEDPLRFNEREDVFTFDVMLESPTDYDEKMF
ncbi:MAG: hypothetical protein Q4E70_02985 [Candidatus Saccharibacteria bacterium]|nr:hypothetical protein [Candidatus Saccharibacteria bacterium]